MSKSIKDPAFLFYTSDFITGTLTMTDAEIGMYVRMLCLQHQTCHLDAEVMQKLCGGIVPPAVMAKFVQDSDGRYYNERLESEMLKRKDKGKKNKKNADIRWDRVRNANAMPFINENENVIENKNVIPTENQKGGLGEKTPDTILPPSDPRSLYAPEMQAKVRENIFELTMYLNSKTGGTLDPHHHQYCSTIWQRLQDGYTFEQMRAIIDTQVPLWIGDAKTRQWLVPTTLFHVDYIDKYLSATKPITVPSSTSTPANIFDRP